MSSLRRYVSSMLILAGALLLLDIGLTIVWQEPVTAAIALIKRSEIDQRYLSFRITPLSRADRVAIRALPTDAAEIAFLARREQREVHAGAAIGRLVINRIGASYEVVQGADSSSLELGPGHYSSTAFPGLGETVAIAGHRTTYLAPFRNINELERGDRIVLKMPYASFTYVVQYQRVVPSDAWWIIRNMGYERLVLSACTPLYSAAQRIVVFARLAGVKPNPALALAA